MLRRLVELRRLFRRTSAFCASKTQWNVGPVPYLLTRRTAHEVGSVLIAPIVPNLFRQAESRGTEPLGLRRAASQRLKRDVYSCSEGLFGGRLESRVI